MLSVATGDIGAKIKTARLAVRPVPPKQTWLADQIGVSQARLSNWESGKHDPPAEIIKRVSEVLNVPESYFKAGVTPPDILGNFMLPVTYPMAQMKYAGLIPAGPWGDPLSSEEFIEVEARYFKTNRFACRVVGDSCYPALRQGDLTIWELDESPSYGLIVIAERFPDSACTVKELDYDGALNRPILVPINPATEMPEDGIGWKARAKLIAVLRMEDGMEKTYYLPTGLRRRHLM